MKADIAWRLTAAAGWYVGGDVANPVVIPSAFIHSISSKNWLDTPTSAKVGDPGVTNGGDPANRYMNADIA